MSIVITLLTVFLVMVSLLLVLITLMQRPKQEGLGAAFGGGMMNDTFGAQTTDVLQKSTVWLTVAFFGTAILLTVLSTRYYESQRDVGNLLEDVQKPEAIPSLPGLGTTPVPATSNDSKTTAPNADSKKSDSKPTTDSAAPTKADSASKNPAKDKVKADAAKPKSDKPKADAAETPSGDKADK